MNFRSRLTLFFVLLVLVPIGSVGFVLYRVLSDRQAGRDDARLAQAQVAAARAYAEATAATGSATGALRADPALLAALRTGDAAQATARARVLVGRAGLVRILVQTGGRTLVDLGARDAVAPFTARLTGAGGAPAGMVVLSRVRAGTLARRVQALTGLYVILRDGTRPLSSPLPRLPIPSLPDRGAMSVNGRSYRVASLPVASFPAQDLRLSLLADERATQDSVSSLGILAGGLLVGFVVLALVFALAISRSLQGQIERFLAAARRLASGDFSTPVPSEGRDEFAALGAEFNKMSAELERRLAELSAERQRLEEAIRRTGEAFGATLDRAGLMETGLITAVEGVGADGGRASVRPPGDRRAAQQAVVGDYRGAEAVLDAAEQAALERRGPAQCHEGERHALAQPVLDNEDEEPGRPPLGVLAVVRSGRPFTRTERDLFHYLGEQTARSIENVALHERVRVQAVTDELTGLSNHRRFQEALTVEVDRAKRFDQSLGLVLLDIDDFKAVNDTYGHQQGDAVLREVARVLRETAREIDEPSRYGGEELAVALPQTDLEGAYNLAERVREAIEALMVAAVDGGPALRVTASFGAAALPESAEVKESLVAAADAALYRAKRSGKNRTERAVRAGADATPAG